MLEAKLKLESQQMIIIILYYHEEGCFPVGGEKWLVIFNVHKNILERDEKV